MSNETETIHVPDIRHVEDDLAELELKGKSLSKIWHRCQQYIEMSDDFEHELWTGSMNDYAPQVKYDGEQYSVRQVAWCVWHLTDDPPMRIYHDKVNCDQGKKCVTHLTMTDPRAQERRMKATFTIGDKTYVRPDAERMFDRMTRPVGDCLIAGSDRISVYCPDGKHCRVATNKVAYGLTTDDDAEIPYHLGTTCGQPNCVKFEHLDSRHSDAVKNAPDVEAFSPEDAADEMELPQSVRPAFVGTWERHGGDVQMFGEYIAKVNYWLVAGKELQ